MCVHEAGAMSQMEKHFSKIYRLKFDSERDRKNEN